jgi:hypothetical protein
MIFSIFFRSELKSFIGCFGVLLVLAILPKRASAHPMPNSLVLLTVHHNGVSAELQLPLSQLKYGFGQDVETEASTLVARLGKQLKHYLLQHIRVVSPNGQLWSVELNQLLVPPGQQNQNGLYQELTAKLWLKPPAGASVRSFTFDYDVIVHQLVTHAILVSVQQDWEAGIDAAHPRQLGVIALDPRSNTIFPLIVNLNQGSWWIGFKKMVQMGMQHIAEGVDHLLFLLALLLPATLIATGKKWGAYGGLTYSLKRLLKIVTAFTLGHSLTLILGALGWVKAPVQWIEALIAFSILVSAIHAMRPLFAGKELYLAAGFGLIHGMAFAYSLTDLLLSPQYLILSILGFNIGIELMQLGLVFLIIPWLVLLSQTTFYPVFRWSGAVVIAGAALAWLLERLSGQSNFATQFLAETNTYALWLYGLLSTGSLAIFWWEKSKNKPLITYIEKQSL